MNPYNWECPHCQRAQTVIDANSHVIGSRIQAGSTVEGVVASVIRAIGCANPDCRKLTVSASLLPMVSDKLGNRTIDWQAEVLAFARLLPESHARPQPEYVPAVLREDYYEACKIRDLSPKAAATLARRCLQGMIRDFAGVSKATLHHEIRTLREQVDGGNAARGVTIETVDAIDHVRKVGNIGAHMEADINVIVPVDPGEAQMLIELVEMLFDEWYIARQKREERLASLANLAAEKQLQLAQGGAGLQP